MKLSIVIPARNEEANIEIMTKLLFKGFGPIIDKLIIVNDCSTDSTRWILEDLSKRNKKILPIHRSKNPGVGNAIKAGYKAVPKSSEYILSLDCDFTKNIKDIKRILNLADKSNVDVILGSRYMKGGKLIGYPRTKKIANRAFHLLARLIFGFPFVDVTNNFKLIKYEVLEAFRPYLKSSGFSINAETGLYPILMGFEVAEIPVSWIGRSKEMGASSFKVLKAGPGYIKVIWVLLKSKGLEKAYSSQVEKRFFNQLVKRTGETNYANLKPVSEVRFKRKAKIVSSIINKNNFKKILELGCGTGIFSRYLLEENPSVLVTAVDISSEAIRVAKDKSKKFKSRIKYYVGDALDLPFASNSFDLVFGNSIIHHLPLDRALVEIKRVLKPGGTIWFCEPNTLNPQILIQKNIPFIKKLVQDSPSETSFIRWRLENKLRQAGFSSPEVENFEFLHPLIPALAIPYVAPLFIFLERVPAIKELSGTLQISGKLQK